MGTIAETFVRAKQLLQAGDLRQAEVLFGEILEADAVHGEALFLLGIVCGQQTRLDEALTYFRRALAVRPNDAQLLLNLGLTCQALGSHEEAGVHLRQAIRIRPDLAAAYFSLGNTQLNFGQLDDAIVNYRQAIRLQPSSGPTQSPTLGPAFLNLANALQGQGRLQEAAACLRDCLVRLPKFVEARYNLGNVLAALRRPDEAAVCYQEVLRLQPSFAAARNNWGSLSLELGRVDEAVEHFEQALRIDPKYVDAYINLGGALRERYEIATAAEAYQQALQLEPLHPRAHNNLAEAYLDLGDVPRAQTHFREALRNNSAYIRPLLNLAANGFYSAAEPGIEEIKARLKDSRLSDDSASQLHFILGYVLDRSGDTDEAFEHFRQGNALRRSLLQRTGNAYDAAAHENGFDRLIEFFTPEFFERTRGFGLATEVPIFIVGMPRSGSTLVEQILSQHSQIHGAGEIKDVTRLVNDLPAKLGTAEAYPDCLTWLNATIARELAETHLRRLTDRGGSAARVTDKMLDNCLHLGFLAVLFPRARVIHCRRDPRDVCLSCFFQYFKGLSFTWDLDDLGRHYRNYERLMAYWRTVLPLPTFEVAYEDLVADLETVSRRLVKFCGLEWEDRCLRFHENERLVHTMSRVQVRQPLYKSSLERWRRYEAHLEPLLRAMG